MRHVKLWLTTVAVLLCSITKMSGEVVLTEADGLLNGLSVNDAGRIQYEYTSPKFMVDEATNTLTFTFLEGYTRSTSLNDKNGYPFVAFSEFYLYDGEGNEVALDASNFSTNAQETTQGPIENICDKDRTTFFHSLWSAGASDYHNLVITLPEGMELQEFSFKYYTRWDSHGIPKKFSIEAGNGEVSYSTDVEENTDGIILSQANGPLGTLQGGTTGRVIRYYSYTSPLQTLDEATNVLAFTFLEGHTVSGSLNDKNGFPFVAFSEFCLYDGEGNEIPLEASNFSTNAQESTEGPISNICDKDSSTFFHTMWSTGASDYHNLIITLPEGMELKEFYFRYDTRQVTDNWSLHGLPKTISIKTGKDVLAEGTCGENLAWSLTVDGNLTISGSGAMYSYATSNTVPWYAYRGNLRKVTMNEGITTITPYAFYYYPNLTSVVIPESVVEIGAAAFRECQNITSLVVDEDNPVYDSRDNCNAIIRTSDNTLIRGCNTTVIPSSVTAIENVAFFCCEGLTGVDIPEGVERIGSYTFGNCYGLQSVSIPKTVSEIDENAFSYCGNLTSIVVDEENPNYHSRDNCNAIIETETNTLVRGTSTTVIPESVKAIGAKAFSGDEALLSVSLPEGVTSIGDYAFSECYGLVSITIPQSVKTIGTGAFYGCGSLSSSIIIPEGVTELKPYTFIACTSLPSVSLPSSLTSIGDYAFYYCSSLASVAIPEKVKTIGEYAFENCSSLSSPITIPEGVTELKPYTFARCTNLPSVSLPSSLTLISDFAFYRCGNLEEVIIPDGVNHIGYAAFIDCSKLKSITIGKNVKIIDNYAFYADAALEKINSFAVTPPQILSSTFYGVNKSTCQLNVFNSAIPAYQSASYWNAFTNIQALRKTVTVSEYGSGTYSSEYALDFSEVEGLKAYAATGYNTRTGVVTLTRMMTAKAGEGLFVKGEPGDYEVLVLEDTDDNTLNMLVGTLEDVTVNGTSSDGLYTNYKYTVKEGDAEPLFYQFADGSTQGAGKAYLQIPTAWLASSEAKSISYRFDDGETTDIEEEELSVSDSQYSIVYDLYGRRVANPVKGGIYIVNGKKVVY